MFSIMRRKIFLLGALLVFLIFSAGCEAIRERLVLEGSGNVVTITEDLVGFTRLEVSHSFDVDISQGDGYKVELRVDDNIAEYLEVTKRGNTLDIDFKESFNYTFVDGVLEASIMMPRLEYINLSGASEARMEGFDTNDRFEVELSGASTLVGDLGAGNIRLELSGSSDLTGDYQVDDVDINVSGASKVTLKGSGGDVRVDVSGSSKVDLEDFESQAATIDASGASQVTLNAQGRVDASASGASDVYQTGSGEFGRIDASGASEIKRR